MVHFGLWWLGVEMFLDAVWMVVVGCGDVTVCTLDGGGWVWRCYWVHFGWWWLGVEMLLDAVWMVVVGCGDVTGCTLDGGGWGWRCYWVHFGWRWMGVEMLLDAVRMARWMDMRSVEHTSELESH